MTSVRLLRQTLLYHWRGTVAVLLGVAVGTAVLTGALLVGDSLRASLRDLTLGRLGWVEHVMLGGKFVREGVAPSLMADRVAAAIVLPAVVSRGPAEDDTAAPRAAQRATLLGIDARYWPAAPPVGPEFWQPRPAGEDDQPAPPGAVVNVALARALGVSEGDTVELRFEKKSQIPSEHVLGRRKAGDVVAAARLTVKAVLPAGGMADFSPAPTQGTPLNVFVPLAVVQRLVGQPARVNALLAGGRSDTETLQTQLKQVLTPDDWGVRVLDPEARAADVFARLDRNRDGKLSRAEARGLAQTLARRLESRDREISRAALQEYYERRAVISVESRQLLIEPAVSRAVLAAAKTAGVPAAPTLVAMANSISDGTTAVPYSVIAALDVTAKPPLGPFVPAGVEALADDEIILAGWPASPLKPAVGRPITVTYFEAEDEGGVREQTATFKFRGTVPLDGPALDPDLSPAFPGITDQPDMATWDAPFPLDRTRLAPRDDEFWKTYRTIPKAYVTLAAGQKLWRSRFGDLTSVRLAAGPGSPGKTDPRAVSEAFRRALAAELRPEDGGFVFEPVRERGLEASVGGTDFGQLFFAFSVFLIAAAMLLVGLLFRLTIDRRAAEIGLLLALGFRPADVRRRLVAEGAVIAAAGGAAGLVGAAGYAWLLLGLLRLLWPGGLAASALHLAVEPSTLVIGYCSALAVSLGTIVWSVWVLGSISPRDLMAGRTAESSVPGEPRRGWGWRVAAGSLLAAGALIGVGSVVKDSEARAGTFFTSGALLLTAGLAALWAVFTGSRPAGVKPGGRAFRTGGLAPIDGLGVRNASRHPTRSILTAGLLASAAFLVIAVESFRPEVGRDTRDRGSGTGGFALLAEAEVPLFQDLNKPAGRAEILDEIERRLGQPARAAAAPVLAPVDCFGLRLKAGDDTSCLNLCQPRQPRLLGVPHSLVERGGFRFAGTLPPAVENPWSLLEQPAPPAQDPPAVTNLYGLWPSAAPGPADDAIPVFGESNSVQYVLHSGLGQTVTVLDEHGREAKLRIVGLFDRSVFQSELVMSEANFLRLYPGEQGFRFFLIDPRASPPADVSALLDTGLANRGFIVQSSVARLEAFLAVENMYLTTFQALGGLGLVLGACGLAVVLLRTVWERRGELALLRALGFRHAAVRRLVLSETAFLLGLGLLIGTVSAVIAVAPHLAEAGAAVPWPRLAVFLGLVLTAGLTAAAVAVDTALRAALVPALRKE